MHAPIRDVEDTKRRDRESTGRTAEPERAEAPRQTDDTALDTLHTAIGNGAVEQFVRAGSLLLPPLAPSLSVLHAALGNAALLARLDWDREGPEEAEPAAVTVATTPTEELAPVEAPSPPAEARAIASTPQVSGTPVESAVPETAGGRSEERVPPEAAAAAAAVPEDAVIKEGEEKPSEGEDTAAAEEPGAGPSGDEAAAWREREATRIRAIRRPNIDRAGAAIAAIPPAAGRAVEVRRAGQTGVKESAQKAIPGAPKAELPQTPPELEPVPEAAAILAGVSSLRLADLTLPALTATAGGILPVLGTAPIEETAAPAPDPALQQDAKAAATPTSPTASQRKADAVNSTAAAPDLEAGRGQAQAPPVIRDEGAPPLPAVPAAARTDMTQVLARLKTTAAADAPAILEQARLAYYDGVLQSTFPDIGAAWVPEIAADLDAELDGIRDAAGITGPALDAAIENRRQELIAQRDQAHEVTKTAAEDARRSLTDVGVETLEIIGNAVDAIDSFIDTKQQAASGGLEAAEVEARRTRLLDRYAKRIAELSRQYERAGQIRMGQIAQQHKRYVDAYRRAEQIETGALKPADDSDAAKLDVRLKAADIRSKSRERITQIDAEFRTLRTNAFTETAAMRERTAQAGRDAARAIRAWADTQLGRERSWLRKLIDDILDWIGQARAASAVWAAERNHQTALSMAADIEAMRQLEIYAANGVDLAAIDETSGLTAEQLAMIKAFAAGPEAGDSIAAVAVAIRTRISLQRRPALTARIEKALLEVDNKEWKKLDVIAGKQRPGFSANDVALSVRDAMRGPGTDEDAIYAALNALTPLQGAAVRKCYADSYDDDLEDDLESELSGAEEDRAIALLEGRQSAADAAALYYAMKGGLGLGTDEDTIWKTLRHKSPAERAAIEEEYKKLSGGATLTAHLHSELGSHDRHRADALMEGNTAKADAIAIDQAMRGGLTGLGTDEDAIAAVYAEIRRDVAAYGAAQNPPWKTAQVEAEIARRNDDIEAAYNTKYREDFPDQQSALRAAYASEMRGPQLTLVNALADSDEAKADAARIRLEVDSIVYASDSTINAVLETQYTRALEDVRRDHEKALQDQLSEDIQTGDLTEDQIAARRRQIERQLEGMARVEAKKRMDALNTRYQKDYNADLKTDLDRSTSAAGTTYEADKHAYVRHKKSLDLLEKGYLTPEEQIYYAVERAGTDEEAITDALKGRTKQEIDDIRAAWNRRFGYGNDNSFDNRILGELSGREDFDVREMLDYGEPTNAKERKERMDRRYAYESGFYTPQMQFDPLMHWMVGDDFALMNRRHREATEAYETWEKEKDPKKREALQRQFDREAAYVSRTADSVRKSVDVLADTVAQVASTVAAIVVGAAVIIFSGGTATPAVLAAAAAWASAAATLTSIAVKFSIKGTAYGYEDIGIDLAIGVVDAVASYFTANLGGHFIKFAEKLAPNLLKSLAKGGPVVRWLGRGLAEGAENVVGAAPSIVTATALDDENWKGDPVQNIVSRSLISLGYAGATSIGASQGLSALGATTRFAKRKLSKGLVPLDAAGDPGLGASRSRSSDVLAARGTPADRLAAFKEFQKTNPKAGYSEFLKELEGAAIARRADAEVLRQQQRELRTQFLADIPPAQRRRLAGLPIERVDDATFDRLTSGSKLPSAVVVVDGRARVILREGADSSALRSAGAKLGKEVQARLVAQGDAVEELRAALDKDLEGTPIVVDEKLKDNTVRVHYDLENGLPTNIRIVAGLGARAIDIALHQGTVRRMQSYAGFAGRVRMLIERIHAFIARAGVPPPRGSRAWEAKLELEKIPKIIDERMAQLRGDLDPATRLIIDDEIATLREQMDFYRDALDVFDKEPGLGYVAAQKRIGIPANYPDLPEGWHYHRNPNGDINVQRNPGYEGKKGKKGRLATNKRGKLVLEFVPDERLTWDERKASAAARGHTRTVSAELDAELQRRRDTANWNEEDVGQVREWGAVIDRWLADVPANQRKALLINLLDGLDDNFGEAAYGKFRDKLRTHVIGEITATQPGKKQMELLRQYLADAPDPATKGAIFTEYRTARTKAKKLEPSIDWIDDSGRGLPNNRDADGAIEITGKPQAGPPAGKYLIDDKAGDKAFKLKQAQDYDELIAGRQLRTGQRRYDGVVLVFENYDAAEAAVDVLNDNKVGKKIFVAYFDDQSKFKWIAR